MKKKMTATIICGVVLLIALVIGYVTKSVDFFAKEAGGNIYAEEYEEKFNVLESVIDVDDNHLTDCQVKCDSSSIKAS